MKKFIMAFGAAALLLGTTACNGGGASAAAGSFEDSLSQTVGEINGMQLNMQYNQIPEENRAQYNKKQMLEGIKSVLLTDTTRQSYVTGQQIAMQLWGQIYMWEKAGINVDRKALYAAYEKAFMADSVADMTEASTRAQQMMGRVNEIMMKKQQEEAEREAKAKANSPEAKKNAADGKAFVEKLMKEDSSVKVTPSGLAYKVVSEGKGETAKSNSRVTLSYKGSLINGKEFDANDNATFSPRQVIPGFGEGIQMMNEGAHYILYIPGDLAYGVDGTPDGSIGANETLIFDVVVKSIDTPAN